MRFAAILAALGFTMHGAAALCGVALVSLI